MKIRLVTAGLLTTCVTMTYLSLGNMTDHEAAVSSPAAPVSQAQTFTEAPIESPAPDRTTPDESSQPDTKSPVTVPDTAAPLHRAIPPSASIQPKIASASSALAEVTALRNLAERDAKTHYRIALLYLECAGWDVTAKGENSQQATLDDDIAHRCAGMPAQPGDELIDALTRAAELNHVDAQFHLATLQPIESKEFTNWMSSAAEGGSVQAQREYARYLHERDAPDLARAYYWYSLAAEGNDLLARLELQDIQRIMTRDDYSRAQRYLETDSK